MRSRLAASLFAALLATPAAGALSKQIANYQISARLDPAAKTVDGRQVLTWINDSPDEIPELQFHLYMNAFRNERSTFLRESGEAPRRLKSGGWGWIDIKSLRIEGGPDLTKSIRYIHPDDDNADDRTVAAVSLPSPLKPGATIRVAIDFRVKLPHVVARTGYHGDFFFVAQWFPKIGVWEEAGERYSAKGRWNCHQFHANSEFYADFGRYDVEITAPMGYVIGATGVEQSRTEDAKSRMATWRFVQEDVHDFAWTASPRFHRIERMFDSARDVTARDLAETARLLGMPQDRLRLDPVKMILLIQPEHLRQAERHFRAVVNAIRYYGLWYGKYPYPTITIVDPPFGAHQAGGMEYPTLITAGTRWLAGERDANPEAVTVHEFGHQYWYGMVANNEFEESWLDEGFNTYSTTKVMNKAYGPLQFPIRLLGFSMGRALGLPEMDWFAANRMDYLLATEADSMLRNSWEYATRLSYGVNSYDRAAVTLRTLENLLGEPLMARILRTYFERWQFRHPATADFLAVVNEGTGKDMKWFFDEFVHGANDLDYAVESVEREEFGGGRKEATVRIRRRGEAIMPVQIRFRFEDGAAEDRQWDGRYRWTEFKFNRAIESVEIDPGYKILLDANYANNSYRVKRSVRTPMKWSASLLFWAQQTLLALGGLM